MPHCRPLLVVAYLSLSLSLSCYRVIAHRKKQKLLVDLHVEWCGCDCSASLAPFSLLVIFFQIFSLFISCIVSACA